MENAQQDPLARELPPIIQESAQGGGDRIEPGKTPDEVQPGEGGDFDRPDRAPLEETPGGGDIDQPGDTPQEVPAQPSMPSEAPPPD